MSTEDESGNAVQMALLGICASFAKYFCRRQWRSKGYAVAYKLHITVDG